MTAHAPIALERPGAESAVLSVAIRTAALSSGLLAGALAAVLVVELSLRTNTAGYIAFHQATTVPFTLTLPTLGAVMVTSLAISLARKRSAPAIRALITVALACGIAGMLVTVAIHFPLNTTIMTWPKGEIPTDFTAVTTRWVIAHLVRTVLTLGAFVLTLIALTRVSRTDAPLTGSPAV